MKIIVFSDSHGRLDLMIAAVEEERPDHIYFLGDYERDGRRLVERYPAIPASIVRGNCDCGGGAAELVVELEGVRFLLTHGHLHRAKLGFALLREAGREAGADMVCFGHTHQALNERSGVWLFNPGTIGGPYGQRTSYGVIRAEGGTLWATIKDTGTG